MIIAVHSYKGGTGKTLISLNLAALFAKMGKRVCLIDLDLRAPSLCTTFGKRNRFWVNDYLSKACTIENVLTDCSSNIALKGKLCVGLANPSIEAIREMTAKDRKWEMEALGRLVSLRRVLMDDLHFDYVFFDTSPGLQYSSINAVITADLALVVTTTDEAESEGTRLMIRDLYDLFAKKTAIIINKIDSECLSAMSLRDGLIKIGSRQWPIVGALPCFCDILEDEGRCIYTVEKPNHPFSLMLQEMAKKLEKLQPATSYGLCQIS